MKPILLLTFALIAFTSCQKKESKPPVTLEQTAPVPTKKLEKDCYSYQGNGV